MRLARRTKSPNGEPRPQLRPGFAAVCLGLATLASCLEFELDPAESGDDPPRSVAVTETFVQEPLPRADLLLVIDNTRSMAQEQDALATQMVALLDDLDAAGVGWQLGVVTTEMGVEEAGWLRGSPWIITPTTEDRDAAFARAVAVGTTGGEPVAGLAAAAEALRLSAPGEANSGFRRSDALLHVVFVSDDDDQSDAWLGDDPVATFLDELSDASTPDLPARASGLVGPTPDGCTSASGDAQAAARYTQVVQGTGGVAVSICEPDFTPVVSSLTEASIEWRTEFVLREAPEQGRVRVVVDDEIVAEGYDLDGRRLIFAEPPAPAAVIEVSYTVALGTAEGVEGGG